MKVFLMRAFLIAVASWALLSGQPAVCQTVDVGISSSVFKSAADTVNGKMYLIKDDSLMVIRLSDLVILERMHLRTHEKIYLTRYEPLVVKGVLCFVDQEGGMLMKLSGDSLVRVDNSYEHRMQAFSTFLTRHDTIFRFGGYGYWSARDFFTYYNETSRDWQTISPLGTKKTPPGLFWAIVQPVGPLWYVFGGYTIPRSDLTGESPNQEVWTFSRDKLKWELAGRIKTVPTKFLAKIAYGDRLLIMEQTRLMRLDFKRNRLDIFQRNRGYETYNLSLFSPFFFNGYFYALHLKQQNNGIQVVKIPEKELFLNRESSGRLYARPNLLLKIMLILVAVIGLILVAVVIRRIRRRKNKIIIAGSQLSCKSKRVDLEDLEISTLNLFLASEEVTSQDIVQLAGKDHLHTSTNIRLKNSIIEQLNLKFNFLLGSGENLITYGPSAIDKRIKVYRIKKEYFQH